MANTRLSFQPKMRLCSKTRVEIAIASGLLLIYVVAVQLQTPLPKTSSINAALANLLDFDAPKTLPAWISKTPLPTVCANESCRRDYALQLHRIDAFPVPKIRHILWRNESVSSYFAQQLGSWQRIHPDWTYVLWRDRDLEPFVAAHFPMLLDQFKSLNQHIMRVDMVRYMLLYKFGGTYADLDYSLARSLDEFRRFHAVLTREPEAHSLTFLGPSWPVKPLASTAFMMSAPGHSFHRFILKQLDMRKLCDHNDPLHFAGPFGLTKRLRDYEAQRPFTRNSMETVYLPPSFSFYPYRNNSLLNASPHFKKLRIKMLKSFCSKIAKSADKGVQQFRQLKNITQLCSNVTNLDPITDSSQPVFAVHDVMKSGSVWGGIWSQVAEFAANQIELTKVIPRLRLGVKFIGKN